MTSATEVLRRMLDERGVEWGDDGYPTTCTVWASDGIVWHGLWRDDCIELIAHLTPEQAIAATLGSSNCTDGERTNGTCRNVAADGFECSECKGWWVGPRGTENPMLWGFRFCPTCGAKVVGSTTNDVDVEVDA